MKNYMLIIGGSYPPRLITLLRDLAICDTVGSRGTQWQDMPAITRFLYRDSFSIHFAITKAKNVARYSEAFIVERP